jgi:hypothetical protein
MILVNIRCIETNCCYDFKLAENLRINQVTDEIVSMIAQKEHLTFNENNGFFLLCKEDKRQILSPLTTLSENVVCSGDTLLLV